MTYRELLKQIDDLGQLDKEITVLDSYEANYYSVYLLPDFESICLVLGQVVGKTEGSDPDFHAGY